MNFIDALGNQPKSWLLAEASFCVAALALIDSITPWQFSLFVFYAAPVFIVALHCNRRVGFVFALCAGLASWLVNFGSYPFGDLAGYGWTGINRLTALMFVGLCGSTLQNFRDETRRRIEALEHTQELEREIVRAGEREQMRIGQDLHDGVCQSLAALDCATECLKRDLETEGSAQATMAAKIQKLLGETTVEARNLARGVFPVTMETDGLAVALRCLVANTSALRHIAISFESDDDIEIRDPEVALHLYRIAQEALNNAIRHASATRVKVRLIREPHGLTISVTDDGCGSSIQAPSDGMGWRSMRYRAKLIGADVKVETRDSGGTIVRCSLPLLSHAAA